MKKNYFLNQKAPEKLVNDPVDAKLNKDSGLFVDLASNQAYLINCDEHS